MSIVYFRDLPPERVVSAMSEVAPQPNCRGQEEARHSWRAWLREWRRRRRSRTLLANLDSHMLKDIGITYAEAEYEVNKLFWLP